MARLFIHLTRKSVVFGVLFAAMAFVGIFKGFAKTNTARRVAAPRQMVLDEGAGEQTPSIDVFRFESIVRTPSNVSFVVHWPTNETNFGYDVFTRPSLGPGAWTWLNYYGTVSFSVPLAVLDGILPDAGTNSPYSSAGFFTLGSDRDTDGDGLSDAWEALVYGTSPTNRDSDSDGLTDGDEVNCYETDPLNPYSIDACIPDGLALLAGRWDPFDIPPGSTNAVWEHVFYTGRSDGAFAYPESSPTTAVLRVSAARGTRGTISVGGRAVPLFDAPDEDEWGASVPQPVFLLSIPRGVRQEVGLRLAQGTPDDVRFASDDFAFGELPDGPAGAHGWLVFPDTRASVPCIHDFNALSRRVSLLEEVGEDSELTCTWQSAVADVAVSNEPPCAARITANFPASASRTITYTLDHPLHLFGRTVYDQTVRFCPQPAETDADSLGSGSTPPWLGGGDGDSSDGDGADAPWCCLWGNCCSVDGTCTCGCSQACCSGTPGTDGEDLAEECPQHHMPYEQCAPAHFTAYTNAVSLAAECPGVLKIREPPDYDFIHLPCSDASVRCCDCPDHGTNYVAVAYQSRRLALVDGRGNDFTRAVEPCTVRVAGVRPSAAVGDATLGFVTNGVAFRTYDYTVLGVGFSKPQGPSLAVYNGLSQTLGVPMTVTTNLNHALRMNLLTNVALPSGNVQFSLDAGEGSQFTVWAYDYRRRVYWRLLETQGHAIVNLPLASWRRLVGASSVSDSPVTPIHVTSAAKGSATLRIGYWCVTDSGVVQDWQSQMVTSVNPPLLPDYNRDGRVDGSDVDAHLRGCSFWYWQNQDTLKGEFIPDGGCGNVLNTGDDEVNGPLDLVNFFPVALPVAELIGHWGAGVSCYVESEAGEGSFKFCFADVAWSGIGSIQTNDVRTVDNQRLCHADLVSMPGDGWRIPPGTLGGFSEGSGILVAEAVGSGASLRLTFRTGNEVLYSYALPMTIVPVRDMYRFYSLRGAEEVACGSFVLPDSQCASALPDEKDLDVFFTHGFNVDFDAARIWGDVLFKRFWISGSRARFNMLTWAGDYHWFNDRGNGLHYQQDVYQAQMTGEALKRLVEREQPDSSKRILMAQSLGNMVACEALREGLNVAKYFMFDAAVASEAVDGSLQSTNSAGTAFASYVPSEWRAYPPLSWSACWFRWFEGEADDARGRMGWPDRFAAALDNAGEVYNYYSTGDEVFHNTASPPWLLEGMSESNANYCWQKQETLKGACAPGGTAYGGWRFHIFEEDDLEWTSEGSYVPLSSVAAAKVANGSITNSPHFNRGYSPMFSYDASQEEVFTALAKYVPAVSSAVGGRLTRESVIENHDLNEGSVYRDGWGRISEDGEFPWKHSDMKDVAYQYVYKLYLQLVEKGGLQ